MNEMQSDRITRIFLKRALSFGGNGSFEGIFGD